MLYVELLRARHTCDVMGLHKPTTGSRRSRRTKTNQPKDTRVGIPHVPARESNRVPWVRHSGESLHTRIYQDRRVLFHAAQHALILNHIRSPLRACSGWVVMQHKLLLSSPPDSCNSGARRFPVGSGASSSSWRLLELRLCSARAFRKTSTRAAINIYPAGSHHSNAIGSSSRIISRSSMREGA